ncbi:hypothetical protein [Actinomadura hibisca]|uniref:hypothetical protein n=1 Tax=Actinomadura hibisca TaxID=68565 RepID=UPI000834E32B|nr:hypothetical protein [Actinomadura hibisca]
MTVHTDPDTTAPPAGRSLLRRARLSGAALTAGALTWVATMPAAESQDEMSRIEVAGGLAFQFGLLPVIALVLAARATGARKGRAFPVVEMALLVPAMLWSALAVVFGEDQPGWMVVLDVCWPLSMVFLLVLGIAVAVTGRFTGLLRWQFLLAGLWFFFGMGGQIVGGDTGAMLAGGAWLVVAYAGLGLRLAITPSIVLPRAGR